MLDKNYKGELDSVECEFRHDLVSKQVTTAVGRKGAQDYHRNNVNNIVVNARDYSFLWGFDLLGHFSEGC